MKSSYNNFFKTNKIQIDNSYFDALDLDFSKIKINDLKVNILSLISG